MDIWVVAVAAGAGYFAKNWQNSSAKEKEGLAESYPSNLTHGEFESRNFFQQIRDRTCPFRRRLARKKRIEGSSSAGDDFGYTTSSETNQLIIDIGTSASTSGKENLREFEYEIEDKTDISDNSVELFAFREMSSLGSRVKGRRHLRSGSYVFTVKPLSSLESCLAAQLYKDQAGPEEYVFSSNPLPCAMAVRPLLVTDGSRIINRSSFDSNGRMQSTSNGYGDCLEVNERLHGAQRVSEIGFIEGQKIEKQKIRKTNDRRRWSSSSKVVSGGSGLLHTQGTQSGMILFFLGLTLGIMSTFFANKREVDKLNNLLEQTENLVQDLHEEIEMKDLFTVKELRTESFKLVGTSELSFLNSTPNVHSAKDDNIEEPGEQKAAISEAMSKIEAELEAELERLELNMKSSSLQKIQDYVELDPNFIPDIVQGDLKLDKVTKDSGYLSDSTDDINESSSSQVEESNYAVSPRELSLRLHEVIESRLESRIMELETELENSQRRVYPVESERTISQWDLYSEMESSSTQESPIYINGGSEIDQPFMTNLSGKALAAFNEAHEEITQMNMKDDEAFADGIYYSNENCEPEEEGEDDDELGELLIKQIVEKMRQGSPLVSNAQRVLSSIDYE